MSAISRRVAVIAPSPVPYTIGGAEKLWWGLLEAFRRHSDDEVELIKLPAPERNFREIIDSYYHFSRLDLNHFDLVISTKYPAWMVRHENHWVYLQHRLRGLYDTYPQHLPLQPGWEQWPPPLQRLQALLALEPHVDHRDELFAAMKDLRAHLPPQQWQEWFALPGPLARMLTRWLDDSALRPGMIRKFMAISHNVAAREGYFPAGVPVQVIHHPSDLPAAPAPVQVIHHPGDLPTAPAPVQVIHHPGDLPTAPAAGQDYFFTASRLDAPKRLDLLVRAFRASDTKRRLLIAGTGPQQSELEALINGDPRIWLLGRVADDVLRRYYSRALCVPYLPLDEDYGLIAVEAMQAGKPVLTCADAGGATELVTDGLTGWIVAPQQGALTAAIERVACAPESALAMAADCRAAVAHVNWRDTLTALLDGTRCVDACGYPEQGKPRHILVPLTFPVYPPRNGGQSRVFHLYRRVAEYVPVTLLTLCSAGEAGIDVEIAPGLRELRIPKSDTHQRGERELERKLKASVADLYAIDHVMETAAYGAALRELSAAAELVIASHPYLYRAIRAVYRGPLYYEAHNVELDMKRDVLREVTEARPWLELVEATEGECCRDAIGICACSCGDASRLEALYRVSARAIAVVPNGVTAEEIPTLDQHRRQRIASRLSVVGPKGAALFMGSWHGPNIEAVRWIMEELAPACPLLNFWVVGSVCQYWKNFRNKSVPANVMLLGQLEEIDKNAVLSCARVALNPVTTGSGSNLKMAEYVVAGLPVVTTRFGCRGLDLADLPTIRVAGLDQFADQLMELVENGREGRFDEEQSVARKALVEAFDWDGIADGYFGHLTATLSQYVDAGASGSFDDRL